MPTSFTRPAPDLGPSWDDDEKLYPQGSGDTDSPVRVRRPAPGCDPDPAVWLTANRMTRTEVCLRLARYLLSSGLATSDVAVALTGAELTRRERPRFPVVRYLAERGVHHPDLIDDWRGTYLLKGEDRRLRLHSDAREGDVVATLADGRRLVAYASAGLLVANRSPAEHKALCAALGRALTYEFAESRDVCAVVVPRSARFRELAVRWRATPGVTRAGLLILTVDRAGLVDGLLRDRTTGAEPMHVHSLQFYS